jgi:uncharacterized protein YaaW (UPF0174 family)
MCPVQALVTRMSHCFLMPLLRQVKHLGLIVKCLNEMCNTNLNTVQSLLQQISHKYTSHISHQLNLRMKEYLTMKGLCLKSSLFG